jgi:hypothetical protein
MSDLSLLCAPKRTSAVPLLWVHALDQLAFARVGVGQLFNLAHRLFRCWVVWIDREGGEKGAHFVTTNHLRNCNEDLVALPTRKGGGGIRQAPGAMA